MHQFVDGEWVSEYEATNEDGEFDRQETRFRDRIGENAEFPAESGRYHLYVSYACPWAHRTLITRALKGLEDAISVDVLDPYRAENGWQFTPEKDGCTPDTVNGFDYLREVYVAADPNYTGRVTVPVLWNTKEETIVNNESAEIMRVLDTALDRFSTNVDLYPEDYREEIDRIIDAIYDPINNGVYRAGFAETQDAYERAVSELFEALDHWNDVLTEQRYLAGDVLTETDIAMFTTLIRFDDVYHTHFKCNRRKVSEYPSLWNYLKDFYQLSGVADTVDLAHIREHYYTTHPDINPKRIVALGPNHDFGTPHDRDRLPGGPPEELLAPFEGETED